MSGICDTCRRKPCPAEGEGLRRCDFYEGGETRYVQLFGTPERAARTLANNCHRDGCIACAAMGFDCGGGDYDALLEWFKGDA